MADFKYVKVTCVETCWVEMDFANSTPEYAYFDKGSSYLIVDCNYFNLTGRVNKLILNHEGDLAVTIPTRQYRNFLFSN